MEVVGAGNVRGWSSDWVWDTRQNFLGWLSANVLEQNQFSNGLVSLING